MKENDIAKLQKENAMLKQKIADTVLKLRILTQQVKEMRQIVNSITGMR